jgi:hypothetical protein
MNPANPPFPEYAAALRQLRDKMQSVDVIMKQLSEGTYISTEVYANNMNMLADFYQDFGEHLQDPLFMGYLRKHDPDLFINILAIGRAVSLMKNLLLNVSLLLKGPAKGR